jgi:hypothetical protein
MVLPRFTEPGEFEDPTWAVRERLRSAARWMRGVVIAQGLISTPFCCYCSLGVLLRGPTEVLLATPLPLILILAYAGAYELEARQNFGLAVAGAVLELLVSAAITLAGGTGAYMLIRHIGRPALVLDSPVELGAIALTCGLGGLGLAASVRALTALFDPAVRTRFR